MRTMNVAEAIKSGAFDVCPCSCGKCTGQEHMKLVSKNPLLLDVRDHDLQSFCAMTATCSSPTLAGRSEPACLALVAGNGGVSESEAPR